MPLDVQKIHQMGGHNAAVYQVLATGLDAFISAGGEGWLAAWSLAQPDLGNLVANVGASVFCMAKLDGPFRWVAGDINGGLHWIDPTHPQRNRDVAHHAKGCFAVLPSGEGHVFSVGGDGYLTRWNVSEGRSIERLQLSTGHLRALALHPEGRLLAVGSGTGHLHLLHPDTLDTHQIIAQAHQKTVFSLAFSPDGRYLVSGGRDAHMHIWQPQADGLWQRVLDIAAHMYTVNCLAFSPDGRLLATASRDKTIKIWDARDFRLLKVLDTLRHGCHINSVNAVAWLSERRFVSCSDDRTLIVWEIGDSR